MELVDITDGYMVVKLTSRDIADINGAFSKEIEEINTFGVNDTLKVEKSSRMEKSLQIILPRASEVTATE